jgi:ABC-type nitrate/sulfonate/bicarbonate transport system substrate-binding protein
LRYGLLLEFAAVGDYRMTQAFPQPQRKGAREDEHIMKRLFRFGAFALAALAFASPWHSQAQAASEKLLISAAVGNAIYWDVFSAVENGYFKDEGFDPHYVSMSSSTNSTQNLVAGAVNIQGGSPEPAVNAIERDAEIGILAAASARSSGLLMARPEIKTLTDLKGKIIGVSALKGGEVWQLRKMLAERGLKPKDYQLIQVGISPLKLAALKRGSIAAAVLLQPSAALAQEAGMHSALDFWEMETYPYPVWTVGRAWAHENNHGMRISRAIAKAHDFLNNPANKAAAIKILQKTTKRSEKTAATTYKIMIEQEHFFVPGAKVDTAGLKRLFAAMRDEGDLKGNPDPHKFLIPVADGGLSK